MPRRFPHLRGDSRLYPFAARTALRRRQKHRAWALRLCGAAVLCLAAGLILRDTVFRGGQPEAPVTTAESTEQSSPTPIAITPRAATVDVLAAESADSDVHSSPAPHPSPDAAQAADILPQYQELYAQNPDLAGWLCINGTNINYPVVQADNSYYLRRGFDRLYSTAGTLFLDERCRLATPNAAGTANALIYGHNTASGSMFSQLLNYADKAFYTAHPTFQFDTLYEEGTWQVAAVLRTELGADALPYYSFFDASTQEEWQQRAADLPYADPYQALIMASLIEKETGVAHERAQIAGVFIRRLRIGMPLQTDPTVIYGMGEAYRGRITRADLRHPTPYNTYTIRGLPPTPIAMVGREAIHAALHPQDGRSLYFVARGDGSHVFSNTLAEHNRAVREYQLKRRADYRSSPAPQPKEAR